MIENKPLVEYALDYARRGWHVFPCKPGNKAPYVRADTDAEGNQIPGSGGLYKATTDEDQIRAWWERWPHAMIGVRMGEASGGWALDPDTPEEPGDADGMVNWANLVAKNGGCPHTHTHLTPRGGKHIVFKWRHDRPITNSEGQLKGLGINVRGNGGYIIAPPSQRHDGKAYEIAEPLDFFHFAEAPEWLYDLILTKPKSEPPRTSISERAKALVRPPVSRDVRPYVEAAVRNEYDAVASAHPGNRNNQLNNSALSLGTLVGAGELTEGEVVEALYQASVVNGSVKDDGHQAAMNTIKSGMSYGIKRPRAIPDLRVVGPDSPEVPAETQPQPAADPVDLWGNFDPPMLPRYVLPDVIERFAFDQGRTMGADMAGVAVSALAVCAAAIPDKVKLQVKRHNKGWLEEARIWVATVGPPSSMKTPIMKAAARPLRRMDGDLARQYQEERSRYESLSKEEKAQTEPPKRTRLMIEDATPEAAQGILKDSPDGVLCYQDEMSGWFGAMDRYSGGKGGDRSFWLQAFNGGHHSVERVGRGSVFIENLSISLLGGIQPEPIRKIAEDSVDDGLLQRLLPVMLKPAVESCDEPESTVVSEYAEMIGRLRRLDEIVLRFDEGAQAFRQELERRHLKLQSAEIVNPKLGSHIGKYNGIFARLCIIWHCAETAALGNVPPIISEATARRAGRFLHQFLLPHAIAFYAGVLGLSNDHDRLTAVAGFILAHKKDKITNRDLKRGDKTMRKVPTHEMATLFEHLEALGWVDRAAGPYQKAPLHWVVNPAVHVKFAEKAESEAERRANAREMIADILGAQSEQARIVDKVP